MRRQPDQKTTSLRNARQRQEIIIGVLVKIDESGPHVEFPTNVSGLPVAARSTTSLQKSDAGREVAMMFEFGDLTRPLIIGLIQPHRPLEPSKSVLSHIQADRIVLEANGDIVLKTKRAKLVLRENGDIEIHGRRIVSRARTLQKLLAPSLKLN